MLDSPEGVCAGQAQFEYPATSVPFSSCRGWWRCQTRRRACRSCRQSHRPPAVHRCRRDGCRTGGYRRRGARRVRKCVRQLGGADRGRRDAHAEPEQLPLDALVAPARVLAGQPNDQLLQLLVELRSPCCVVWVGPGARDEAAVPAQQRLGLDKKQDQRERGRARLNAASGARSAGWGLGRATRRRSTVSWWRSTRISKSLAASPRASRTSSWMERHSARWRASTSRR
jgi:hypothetical protein